jgi:excisionase family DNA binding protein
MSDLRAALVDGFILDALLERAAPEPGTGPTKPDYLRNPSASTGHREAMSSIQILQEPSKVRRLPPSLFATDEIPLTVKQAAAYLGVSRQTVYLWVERKQIPHLRVMGRNIRFLKSELEPFRAQFKQEMGNGKTEQT